MLSAQIDMTRSDGYNGGAFLETIYADIIDARLTDHLTALDRSFLAREAVSRDNRAVIGGGHYGRDTRCPTDPAGNS
jgi:hypothetical protein